MRCSDFTKFFVCVIIYFNVIRCMRLIDNTLLRYIMGTMFKQRVHNLFNMISTCRSTGVPLLCPNNVVLSLHE